MNLRVILPFSRAKHHGRRIAVMILYFSMVFFTNKAIALDSTYSLLPGQWEQLVVPGNSSGVSIREIFGDDLPESQYNSSWVIYIWNNQTGEFINPGLDGSIPTGQGFWMFQNTNAAVTLDAPNVEDANLIKSGACPSRNGCAEVTAFYSDSASTFAMIGSSQQVDHAMDALTFSAPTVDGDCADGCSHSSAVNAGYMYSSILRYNPSSGQYEDLRDAGALGPWQSAWFQRTTALSGQAASYLFPAPAEPEPDNGECQNAPTLAPVADAEPGKTVVRINNNDELQNAISNLAANSVLLIEPGEYRLSGTLWIKQDNVTIRGNSDRCDAVRLIGMGMDNAAGLNSVPHGVWTNANNTKIQNVSIEEVWYHPIAIDPLAQSPQIYNVRMLNAGEQFVKVSSSSAQGADNGRLEYSVMKYTDGIPKVDHGAGIGYTQGISLHTGDNWVISHNRFENFHTPDNAVYLWNPVVTAWSSASNTVVDSNVFIDVDRAIAFGLRSQENDHSGGIIRNNMIVLRENLFSEQRKINADALVIVWNSPDSQVVHNTIVTNGNTPFAIELRFNSNNAVLRNNLSDAPIRDRSSNQYVDMDNIMFDDPSIFVDANNGDLHLKSSVAGITKSVPSLSSVPTDFDGQNRGGALTDAGADALP